MASFSGSFSGASGGFSTGGVTPPAVVVSAPTGRGPRRIHPRWIREDIEDELPEVIRKKTRATKRVEKLLAKQQPNTDVVLDPFQTKTELQAAFEAANARIRAQREADEDDELILLLS